MKVLTPEQERVLDFVVQTQRRTGAPPTLREIAVHFGYPGGADMKLLRELDRQPWAPLLSQALLLIAACEVGVALVLLFVR